MKDIELALEDYGLTKNEISVYLNCLKLGTSSVYKLSEKCGLPKSTCYDTLKSLQEKGLIAVIIIDNKKNFEAAEPEKIIGILEEKKKRIETIMPMLKQIKKSAIETPKVEMYKGKEGVKTILETVLQTNEDFSIIGNFEKFKEYLQFSSDVFVKRRLEKKIACHLIEEKTKENIKLAKKDRQELRKTKFLSGLEKINSECYIYGNNIALLTLLEEEPIGIIIENSEIAKLFRILFKKLWEIS